MASLPIQQPKPQDGFDALISQLARIKSAESWQEIDAIVGGVAGELAIAQEYHAILMQDLQTAREIILQLQHELAIAQEDKVTLEEEYAHLEGALGNWHWIGDKALALLLPDAVRDALRNAREQAFDEAQDLLEMEGLEGAVNTLAGILSNLAGESKLHPHQTFVRLAECILYGDSETLANDPRLSNALAMALDGLG